METIAPLRVAIIGGGGYIGYHIGVKLFERGHFVTLFDISQPDSLWQDLTNITEVATGIGDTSWSDGEVHYKWSKSRSEVKTGSLNFTRGSLLDKEPLERVIRGVECVIHCASYGMSGREQMPSQWTLTEDVNIFGLENVLKLCHLHGIRGLVYTSSFNVVYGGQKIVNGDESLPYFPLHKHEDHYSRTKSIAERLVLFSDNLLYGSKSSNEGSALRTCALRLAGVMGLGEKRHLPRIVSYFDFMIFKYGYEENSLQQFVTLRNVVQAHVKAAESLVLHPDRLGGQAYFISDGDPINSFEFLRPLRESLGYRQPWFNMPMWFLWGIVYLIQVTHGILSKIHSSLDFPPMLTPAEVYKTAQTHFFSSEKAKRDFGYVPERPNDISDVIKYYCEKQKCSRRRFPPHKYVVIVVALTITFMFLTWIL